MPPRPGALTSWGTLLALMCWSAQSLAINPPESARVTSTALSTTCNAGQSVLPESGFGQETRTFAFAGVGGSANAPAVNLTVWQDWATFGLSCVVWPSSVHLAQFLAAQRGPWSGKRVVELGAGNGLVGLTLAGLGATVAITDRSSVLECARRNIRRNRKFTRGAGGSATSKQLSWCEDSVQSLLPVDYVVGADLVYDEAAFKPLVCALRQLSVDKTTTYLAGKVRYAQRFEQFRGLLTEHFHVERVSSTGNEWVGANSDFYIYKVTPH